MTESEIQEWFTYQDGQLLWKKQRGKCKAGSRAGCKNADGYWVIRFNDILMYEHRLVWVLHYGQTPGVLDHVDQDKANNRIENLRAVSYSENNMNSPLRRDNTSGCRGVSRNKRTGRWDVEVRANQKRHRLGSFDDFEFACLVADEARDLYHNKFKAKGY